MTRYTSGRKAEYEVMDNLGEKGWITGRTAGSHGVMDVIAFKDGEIRVIQCKAIRYKTKKKKVRWHKFNEDIKKLRTIRAGASLVMRELWVKVKNKGWEVRVV